MNIFYLDGDPQLSAEYHCDKHCVKMLLEYTQILSTAHRVLDGKEQVVQKNGRKRKTWVLSDEREDILYESTHINHPSTIWARSSKAHYQWLFELTKELGKEYTKRYGKVHASISKLSDVLESVPNKILNTGFSEPPAAMPDHCKVSNDSVASYRNYYLMEKKFAAWNHSKTPAWFCK